MTKQKRFIRVPDSTLPLYNGLQSMIKTTKRNGVYISRIENGSLDITDDDIDFLKRNNYHSTVPTNDFINAITLFTKQARFYDNIPIKYSFCDEGIGTSSAYVFDEILYITLPMCEAEEADSDAEIVDYVLKNMPLDDGTKHFLSQEFKLAVYAYKYKNNQQAILTFYRLIEIIVPIDVLNIVTYLIKQAFNLYLFQKNIKNKNYESHTRLILEDVKFHVEEENSDNETSYNPDYDDES